MLCVRQAVENGDAPGLGDMTPGRMDNPQTLAELFLQLWEPEGLESPGLKAERGESDWGST